MITSRYNNNNNISLLLLLLLLITILFFNVCTTTTTLAFSTVHHVIRRPIKQITFTRSSSSSNSALLLLLSSSSRRQQRQRRQIINSSSLSSSFQLYATSGGGGGGGRAIEESRRDILLKSATAAATAATAGVATSSNAIGGNNVAANAAAVSMSTTSTSSSLIADVPMIRLQLPKNAIGDDYVAMQICIQNKPYEFMLDTGLTLELITPHLQKELALVQSGKKSSSSSITGLAAGGTTTINQMIELKDVTICTTTNNNKDQNNNNNNDYIVLPEMHAIVTDFPQEHVDPKHDPIEGMIGLEILEQYDVDLDFPNQRIRFYKPGTAPKDGLVCIPAVVINDTGVLGIRVTTPGQNKQQPIIGIVDCGSSFSAVNTQAAQILGINVNSKPGDPSILAIGIDGKPIQLPIITKQSLSYTGDVIRDNDNGRIIGFESPPSLWKPWKSIRLAVGDLPVFSELLGDGKSRQYYYNGPAALIGLDILAQRRIVLESAGSKPTSRQRRIYVSPS